MPVCGVCAPIWSLQWSHDLSAMDTQERRILPEDQVAAFNGATTFQPWIQHTIRIPLHMLLRPSMEPRPFSHGYSGSSGSNDCLQWSHDLSAMDTAAQAFGIPRQVVGLQWSHDLSAMDTPSSRSHPYSVVTSLQWSHDLSAMDTTRAWARTLSTTTALQWSHDLSAMDTAEIQDLPHKFCRSRPRFQVSASVLLFDR